MSDDRVVTAEVNPDPAKNRTAMAVERTVMAADRSLMAWVRTGLSLISFGFTIYKFLEYSREQLQASGIILTKISSPKVTGLMLIGMGIFSLILGIVENVHTMRVLRRQYEIHRTRYSLFMSIILTLFGIMLFLGVILKLQGIG
jgi:putative membrane protein